MREHWQKQFLARAFFLLAYDFDGPLAAWDHECALAMEIEERTPDAALADRVDAYVLARIAHYRRARYGVR